MSQGKHQTTGKMRSTWHLQDRSKWTWAMQIIQGVQPHDRLDPPQHFGKLPVLTAERGILMFAPKVFLALLPHYLNQHYWQPLPWWGAMLYWIAAYNVLVGYAANTFIKLAYKWGHLDGSKPRDKVPDYKVPEIAAGFIWTSVVRIGLGVHFLYRPEDPLTLSPFFPLKLFVFALVLDLFFYIYHRSCHEIDWLWKIHQTHHLTKHPSPSLALLADPEQEFIEAIAIPVLSTIVCRALFALKFPEWVLIIIFINMAEVIGHTGIRAHMEAFNTAFVLKHISPRLVLTIEDHDLHHRNGWRKSSNYGKQSLFWDYLFGTVRDRPEGFQDNVDWNLSVFDDVPADHTKSPATIRS